MLAESLQQYSNMSFSSHLPGGFVSYAILWACLLGGLTNVAALTWRQKLRGGKSWKVMVVARDVGA